MDLNKIKLLGKNELLQKLKQSGFSGAATILEDKEINGEKFIELKEFETFKWKLSPAQKKNLWNCIKEIRANPSVLGVKEKPKPAQKPTFQRLGNTNETKLFKGKLESLLGATGTSAGSSSTFPRVTQLEKSNLDSDRIKKPALPLPPKARQTDTVIKKSALPTPKETENADEYLDMHPPKQIDKTNEADNDYLTPKDLENEYEAPPKVTDRSRFPTRNVTLTTKVNAPTKNSGAPPPPPLPNKSNVTKTMGNRRFNSNSVTNSEDDFYEDILNTPHLPGVPHGQRNMSVGNTNSGNNLSGLGHKQLPSSANITTSNKYLIQVVTVDHNEVNYDSVENEFKETSQTVDRRDLSKDGKSPPPLKSTVVSNNTKREQSINEGLRESNGPSTKKTSIKDLENVIIVNEKESSLSKISYTLSNIFRKNKSKNSYENYAIESETLPERRQFSVKERPLPAIPLVTASETVEETSSRFLKPFPVPREDVSHTDPLQNYVELTKNVPGHLIQPSVSQKSGERKGMTSQKGYSLRPSLPLPQPSPFQKDEDEEDQVYENTATTSHKGYLDRSKLSLPQPPPFQNKDEKDEVYENAATASHKDNLNRSRQHSPRPPALQQAEEEEEEVYENTGNVSQKDNLNRSGQHLPRPPALQQAEEEEVYENTGNVSQKGNFLHNQKFPTPPPLKESIRSATHLITNTLNQEEELPEYGNAATNNHNQQIPIQNQLISILAQQLKERNLKLNEEKRKSTAIDPDSDFDDEFDDDEEQPVYGNTPDQNRSTELPNLKIDNENVSYDNIEAAKNPRPNLTAISIPAQNKTSFLFSHKTRSPILNAPQEIDDDENSNYGNLENSGPNPFLMKNISPIRTSNTSHEDRHNRNGKDEKPVPIFNRPLPNIPKNINNSSGNSISENKSPIGNRGLPTPPSSDEEHNNKEAKIKDRQPITNNKYLSKPFVVNKEREVEDRVFNRPLPKLPTKLNYEFYKRNSEKDDRTRATDVPEEEIQQQRVNTNLNDEPFFRNTDRKGARALLRNLEDGAFLIRPGGSYPLALTVKYNKKFYNLGIERNPSGRLQLHADYESMSPEFASLRDFVDYFVKKPVTFQEKDAVVEIYLKPVLPLDQF